MSNFSEGDVFHNRYKLLQYIGGGELSEVWKVYDELAGIIVAIKIYVRVGDAGIKQFIKDFTLTEALNHPYILKPSHVDVCDRRPYLILKYCSRGAVSNRIEEGHEYYSSFSEKDIAIFMSQIGGALAYLHANDILHRDIKPDNVLVSDSGEFLLTDFGISKKAKSSLSKATSSTQAISFTRPYAPPEILTGDYDAKKDIFSLGVTFYELLAEELPFEGNGGTVLLMGGSLPNLPERFSPALNALVRKCMAKDGVDRPTAAEIEQWAQEYLKTGKWPVVETKSIKKRSKKILDDEPAETESLLSKISTGASNFGHKLSNTTSHNLENVKPGIAEVWTNHRKTILYTLGGLAVVLVGYFVLKNIDFSSKPDPVTPTETQSTPQPDSLLQVARQQLEAKDFEGAKASALAIVKHDSSDDAQKKEAQAIFNKANENSIAKNEPIPPVDSKDVKVEDAKTVADGKKIEEDKKVQKLLESANSHFENREYMEAYRIFKELCGKKQFPDCSKKDEAEQMIRNDIKGAINEGKSKIGSNPEAALNFFRTALDLVNKSGIVLPEDLYGRYLEIGKYEQQSSKNYKKALIYFEAAKIFRNTSDVNRLIKECQDQQ